MGQRCLIISLLVNMPVAFPAYTESWTQHKGKNCYSGHGAVDLDSGHGCGTMSIAACQAKCDVLLACTGITMESGPGNTTCYRRTNIELDACVDGNYDTWTKSVAPPPSPPPAIPGLVDVCAHLNKADRCSPAICEMKAFQEVKLEAKTYYQDRSILLPEGSKLIGQGINKTYIVSCGAPSSGRRGFILNNNTHLGHFTWQGLQASRGNFDAAVGTPGCLSTSCQGGCIPKDGNCAGIENAVVEHIHNSVFTHGEDMWPLSTSVGWFPKTLPWGPQMATGSFYATPPSLSPRHCLFIAAIKTKPAHCRHHCQHFFSCYHRRRYHHLNLHSHPVSHPPFRLAKYHRARTDLMGDLGRRNQFSRRSP